MTETATTFAPERYRGYLRILAKARWPDVLNAWCEPSAVVNQTIFEAMTRLDSFRGATAAEFEAWLRTILARNLVDEIRKARRKKCDPRLERSIEEALADSSSRFGLALAADDSSPSDRAARVERLDRLADALAQLPPDQLEAVTLHHLRGLSLKDTAARMGKSVPAVAGLLRRGLEGLRTTMAE